MDPLAIGKNYRLGCAVPNNTNAQRRARIPFSGISDPPKAPSSSLRSAQSVSTPYVAAICRGHMPLLETALPRCLIARRCEWAAKCICMFVFRVHSQRFVFSLGTQFNGRSDDRRSASHFFNSGCALLRVRHGNGGQDKKFRYKHQKS